MRLLHVTEACSGGVYRHLSLLIPALAQQGVECGVLLYGNRLEESLGEIEGARMFRERIAGMPLRILCEGRRLIQRYVKEYEPDVVFLHSFIAGVSGRLGLSGTAWAGRCVYVPHAFSFHRPRPWWERGFVWLMERHLASRTAGYVCVGPGEVEDAKALGVKSGRVHYCPNGLPGEMEFMPREEARRYLGLPMEGIIGVCPARWEPQKGVSVLLQAMRLLKDEGISVYCYGRGSLEGELARKIVTWGLEKTCVMRKEVPGLWRYLKGFDFLVLPSWYEGSSYVLLEAMAAGVPAVASDIPGAPRGATLFPPGDWKSLERILAGRLWQVPEKNYPSVAQQSKELVTLCTKILRN